MNIFYPFTDDGMVFVLIDYNILPFSLKLLANVGKGQFSSTHPSLLLPRKCRRKSVEM
jgi:hypothetical protein